MRPPRVSKEGYVTMVMDVTIDAGVSVARHTHLGMLLSAEPMALDRVRIRTRYQHIEVMPAASSARRAAS